MPNPSRDNPSPVLPAYADTADSLLAAIVETIGDAIVAIDAEQRIVVFNRGAESMFGYTSTEMLGQPLSRLIPREHRERHADWVDGFRDEPDASRRMGERRVVEGLRRDGSRFAAGATIARVEGPFGRILVAVVRDISEQVETRASLEASLHTQHQLARTDPVTGLWNARALRDAVERERARLPRLRSPFTLIYLDLDHFKSVNDRFGHAAGDAVLRRFGWRLQETFRALDTVARIGGDEFAVLSPDSTGDSVGPRLESVSDGIARESDERIPTRITVSIGVLTCYEAPPDVDTCIEQADRLMYRVKRTTRNAIAYGTFGTVPGEGGSD